MFNSKILSKNEVADSTYEFIIDKPDGYQYKAGQHAGFTVGTGSDSAPLRHTFSFTSSPNNEHMSFLTRIRDSEFKQSLNKLQIGDQIEIAPPGGFEIAEGLDNSDILFYIAGGIGITPLLSYIRSAKDKPKVHLFWSNQTISSTPLFDSFTSGEFSRDSSLTLDLFLTREGKTHQFHDGRISKEVLSPFISTENPKRYYIIGAQIFVESIFSTLLSIGVPFESVVTENFSGY